MALKAHRCLWSGQFPPNSLAAIAECHQERVAEAEIDLWLLRDTDGLVDHDGRLRMPDGTRRHATALRLEEVAGLSAEHRPPLISEVIAAIREEPYRTQLEIDLKDERAWPEARAREIAGLLAPVRERVILAGEVAETLRRIVEADAGLRIGFNPRLHLPPLPRTRRQADALVDGLCGLRGLLPAARELHLAFRVFDRVRALGVADAAERLRGAGWRLDVWTLDAGMRGWRAHLEAAVSAGVDMITTNTPRALARAHRQRQQRASA